ncbi:hypothetical protein [Clostridium sp. 1xD42-85]|uniref:hypothetical protein n=1 Tax=Clostridium sp. 1xD42-85 TaxID=2320084 RepID=UPI000EA07553|nr:hypothetical protein [Clostridium sp. 1xD42-85]NBJ68630.1 hypothetical protein [Roseburia sp. 1XD42-34]RKI80689.1 hypothetical protein D7V87_03955 [Clostridium sp. 1xD42-85]
MPDSNDLQDVKAGGVPAPLFQEQGKLCQQCIARRNSVFSFTREHTMLAFCFYLAVDGGELPIG